MNVAGRINDMGRSAALLSLWVFVASAGELFRSARALDDAHGVSRVVLSLLGIAAALILWSGWRYGRDGLYLIIGWSALQVPFVATEPDGNYTRQLVDILIGMTDQVAVNGEVTSYTAFGLNLAGVILLGWAVSTRERIGLWRRRSAPSPA